MMFERDAVSSARYRKSVLWKLVFIGSTAAAVLALVTLLLSILNGAFGYTAVQSEREPETLTADGRGLSLQPREELLRIIGENLSAGLLRRLESEAPLEGRNARDLAALIEERIVKPRVAASWTLAESLFKAGAVREYLRENPGARPVFRSWVSPRFLASPQSSEPEKAGIRIALLGSLWMILITMLTAFPVGIGAAIYLEEYAAENRLTRLIQVNIYNLAGVPSIIYGLLGLAVFVRRLEPVTSGHVFGVTAAGETANGRTILSAGLTLALLILPTIIINAQEAFRAVPSSLRESSYGLGATKWQTIRHHVLPASMDRILTGTILAVSRAIGETAPLVVVGASTFIAVNPAGFFSKFTTLPIQIYQWTARPQPQFRNVAAAAIVVLMVLLLSMNTAAILLRNRYSRKKRLAL